VKSERLIAAWLVCAIATPGCSGGPDETARAPGVEASVDALATAERNASATPATEPASAELGAGRDSERGPRNVDGAPLAVCSLAPKTGFHRDGLCTTGPSDLGKHVVCAEVTAEFLEYTAGRGNDLTTPSPRNAFPGLRAGDHWCLCASRWLEALEAGVAPKVKLDATSDAALRHVSRADLDAHAR
jgi:uncharacterized protein (DUF2237 family)